MKVHNNHIFPGAKVLGEVTLGKGSVIWFNAVVRGDIEPITIGNFSNVQDNCVLHASKNFPVKIGSYVSIGHAAVLHGCQVEDNCIIGMNSTLLNGAHIEENSIVGAGAVVSQGKKFPPESLILGVPAKFVRKLKPEEIQQVKENAQRYVDLAQKHVQGEE